jgi:non-heme chloroperoxidase
MISSFVESQGIKLHYLAGGKGEPALLFVPGVTMPAWIFEKQLAYFSKKYRVVAMDTRSQGESEQTTEGHYALAMAKDIKAVVDTLKLQPLILIGWSLAVPEVVNYAYHFGPQNLQGLVLIDGLPGMDPSLPFYRWIVDYWTELQTDRVSRTREFIRTMFKQPQSEAYLEKIADSSLLTPTNTVMTLMENYILQDFRPLLPHIEVPTLVVTVKEPFLDYMQQVQKSLPQGRLEVVESAGHALFVDQPEAFNRILDGFIDETK